MVDMDKRDRPYSYICKAIEELKRRNTNPFIVEIGSMRGPCNHPIDECYHPCCSDGHSSLLWARTSFRFHTIDIEESSYEIVKKLSISYPLTSAFKMDGIEYLKNCRDQIDLLFLDAWDLELVNSAENHLKAFVIAEKMLTDKSLVLVDDTDLDRINNEYFCTTKNVGGKGELLDMYMKDKGWKIMFNGRQTMWSK